MLTRSAKVFWRMAGTRTSVVRHLVRVRVGVRGGGRVGVGVRG